MRIAEMMPSMRNDCVPRSGSSSSSETSASEGRLLVVAEESECGGEDALRVGFWRRGERRVGAVFVGAFRAGIGGGGAAGWV